MRHPSRMLMILWSANCRSWALLARSVMRLLECLSPSRMPFTPRDATNLLACYSPLRVPMIINVPVTCFATDLTQCRRHTTVPPIMTLLTYTTTDQQSIIYIQKYKWLPGQLLSSWSANVFLGCHKNPGVPSASQSATDLHRYWHPNEQLTIFSSRVPHIYWKEHQSSRDPLVSNSVMKLQEC